MNLYPIQSMAQTKDNQKDLHALRRKQKINTSQFNCSKSVGRCGGTIGERFYEKVKYEEEKAI